MFPAPSYAFVLLSLPLLPLFVLYSYYYSVFQSFKRFGFLTKLVLFDNIANFVLVVAFLFGFGQQLAVRRNDYCHVWLGQIQIFF
jgi:hypothetical protein